MTILFKILNFLYSLLFKKKAVVTNNDSNFLPDEVKEKVNSIKNETFAEYLKRQYLLKGAEWDEEVNIFGIRDTEDIEQDIFNDYIGLAINGEVYLFEATCDPGVYWTKKHGVGNKGVAHICLGFHKNVYQVGSHKGKEGMVQYGASIKIWRDKDNNFYFNEGDVIETGFFGVNIHRASIVKDIIKIGRWSGGCQVIRKNIDINKFMKLIKSTNKYKKNKKARFSYMLFSKEEIKNKFLK